MNDIGAHGESLRALWKNVLQNAEVLVFVVDASDRSSMYDAKKVFQEYLYSVEAYQNKLFLILANKQDKPNCMTDQEVAQGLGLSEQDGRVWHVQATSAFTGQGLTESLDWIIEQLSGEP